MDHCRSPLEPACPPQADSEGRESTHVRISRGGWGVSSHSRTKTPPKEIQAGGFPHGGTFGMVLLNAQKYRRYTAMS